MMNNDSIICLRCGSNVPFKAEHCPLCQRRILPGYLNPANLNFIEDPSGLLLEGESNYFLEIDSANKELKIQLFKWKKEFPLTAQWKIRNPLDLKQKRAYQLLKIKLKELYINYEEILEKIVIYLQQILPEEPKKKEECKEISPDMEEALKFLDAYRFKCPTDTKEVLVYEDGVYKPAEAFIHTILESNYKEKLKRFFVEEVYAHLQRANYVERAEINMDKSIIPLKNGLFNLETKEIEDFNPDYIFTYKFNVEYNPEAKCPNWIKFAEDVVSKEDLPLLQEIMGYCIIPSMPIHKMFWFYGKGRNGKGRVVITLEALLGASNCSQLNLSEFSEVRRFSLSQLYGKLLNTSSEPRLTKFGLETTVLKMATGQDTISAELKGQNKRLQFKNCAKLIVLGNHFPRVEDNSLGWWDRVVVLNFPKTFEGEQKITDIEKRWIPDELPGILNWMLEGLKRLLEKGEFSLSKNTQDVKIEFMRVSDPFNSWILEKCQKIPNAWLTHEEALTAYYDYCDELETDRDNKRNFFQKLRQEAGVTEAKKRIEGQLTRIFLGISIKSETENEAPELRRKVEAEAFQPSPSYYESDVRGGRVNIHKIASISPPPRDASNASNNASNSSKSRFFVCTECKELMSGNEHRDADGKILCEECFKEKNKVLDGSNE